MMLLPLLIAAAPIFFAQEDEFPDGNKLVHVSLLADHAAVKPGGTATLAVRYAIEPKWHIYWQNPGDSGLATRAKIEAPEGWKVGAVQFPAPMRREDPGDITTFVFENELVLLADLTVPANAKPGSKVTLSVEGSWLVCTDLCVPGEGKASIEIDVADADQPANGAVFTAAHARMPKPMSELAQARMSWTGDESEPRWTLIVPGATELDYFPLDIKPVRLESRSIDIGQSGGTLRATFSFQRKKDKDEPRIRGVLRVRTASGEACYALDHLFTPPKSGPQKSGE